MRLVGVLLIVSILVPGLPARAQAIEADEFDELVGYTVVAATELARVEQTRRVISVARLQNGMTFELDEDVADLEGEAVAVFAKRLSADEVARLGIKAHPGKALVLYKILIQDQLLDGLRVH